MHGQEQTKYLALKTDKYWASKASKTNNANRPLLPELSQVKSKI